MPPTHTDEGLRAARAIREEMPGTGVLVLSAYLEEEYALELVGEDAAGVGYLLKDRVSDGDRFAEAVRRVAEGGSALDPEVVSQMLGRRRAEDPLEELTPREREVLGLMAEGTQQPGDRRCARDLGARRGEACDQHLRQARTAAGRRGPSSRAGSAGVLAIVGRPGFRAAPAFPTKVRVSSHSHPAHLEADLLTQMTPKMVTMWGGVLPREGAASRMENWSPTARRIASMRFACNVNGCRPSPPMT